MEIRIRQLSNFIVSCGLQKDDSMLLRQITKQHRVGPEIFEDDDFSRITFRKDQNNIFPDETLFSLHVNLNLHMTRYNGLKEIRSGVLCTVKLLFRRDF